MLPHLSRARERIAERGCDSARFAPPSAIATSSPASPRRPRASNPSPRLRALPPALPHRDRAQPPRGLAPYRHPRPPMRPHFLRSRHMRRNRHLMAHTMSPAPRFRRKVDPASGNRSNKPEAPSIGTVRRCLSWGLPSNRRPFRVEDKESTSSLGRGAFRRLFRSRKGSCRRSEIRCRPCAAIGEAAMCEIAIGPRRPTPGARSRSPSALSRVRLSRRPAGQTAVVTPGSGPGWSRDRERAEPRTRPVIPGRENSLLAIPTARVSSRKSSVVSSRRLEELPVGCVPRGQRRERRTPRGQLAGERFFGLRCEAGDRELRLVADRPMLSNVERAATRLRLVRSDQRRARTTSRHSPRTRGGRHLAHPFLRNG